MTEKQQQYIIDDGMLMAWRSGCINPYDEHTYYCKRCEYSGKDTREGCCEFDDDDMQKIFQRNPVGDIIPLTPALTTYYTERFQSTGKPVSALVLQDLAALHRKRVAREEKRVFKEIEFERL